MAGLLFSVELSTGEQSFQQLEDGSERNLSTADSGTGTEAPSSTMVAEKIAVVGCVIASIMTEDEKQMDIDFESNKSKKGMQQTVAEAENNQ